MLLVFDKKSRYKYRIESSNKGRYILTGAALTCTFHGEVLLVGLYQGPFSLCLNYAEMLRKLEE